MDHFVPQRPTSRAFQRPVSASSAVSTFRHEPIARTTPCTSPTPRTRVPPTPETHCDERHVWAIQPCVFLAAQNKENPYQAANAAFCLALEALSIELKKAAAQLMELLETQSYTAGVEASLRSALQHCAWVNHEEVMPEIREFILESGISMQVWQQTLARGPAGRTSANGLRAARAIKASRPAMPSEINALRSDGQRALIRSLQATLALGVQEIRVMAYELSARLCACERLRLRRDKEKKIPIMAQDESFEALEDMYRPLTTTPQDARRISSETPQDRCRPPTVTPPDLYRASTTTPQDIARPTSTPQDLYRGFSTTPQDLARPTSTPQDFRSQATKTPQDFRPSTAHSFQQPNHDAPRTPSAGSRPVTSRINAWQQAPWRFLDASKLPRHCDPIGTVLCAGKEEEIARLLCLEENSKPCKSIRPKAKIPKGSGRTFGAHRDLSSRHRRVHY